MKMSGNGGLFSPFVTSLLVVIVCLIEPSRTKGGKDFGGSVRGARVLFADDSPVYVRTDIVIESGAKLIVNPDVELRFAPGVGITVERGGTLYAKGEPGRQINFTRIPPDVHWSDADEGGAWWPGVRLVDGDSVLQGRLQMFYKGKWRTVCTNSKNWTESDLQVMCRQMGFSGGLLYRWFPRSNDSSQLLYEDPRCYGNESSLSACPNWENRQLGSGVCDYHEDIGIECDKNVGYQHQDYWSGMKFHHAEAKQGRLINKVMRKVSLSSLEHVSIHFAGRDFFGNATPALFITGVSPQMKFVDIRWSAYDGIHYEKPSEGFILESSLIAENRGYGIFVNDSIGLATLSEVVVKDNGGDGIHYVHHEDFIADVSLCETGNIGYEQTYPLRRSLLQQKGRNSIVCKQEFQVASWTGHVLTVHFLGMKSDTDSEYHTGHIEVYDGPTENSRLLADVPVLNNTKPQSVTSSKQRILLKYLPAKQEFVSFVSFTVEIVANPGRAYDLNLTSCNVTGNNGKGVVVKDQRSGVLVNGSIVTENSHLAGLDIAGGSGDLVVNNSYIIGNIGDGINVTSAGGFIHIDRTYIVNNTGRGIAFWFNESSTSMVFNHTAHISRSEVVHNGLYGILIGNQCESNALWNISLNSFQKNQDSAVFFSSCWLNKKSVKQANILITHNKFLDSDYLAIKIFPALNIHALIEHNEFQFHRRGAVFISGVEEDGLNDVPVKFEIQFNLFMLNSGTFVVNIGLIQGSFSQELIFTKNRLEENVVQKPFPSLNPRSRVAAVIVVSSENALIYRNYFNNPQSTYELGSHLERHDMFINATHNYWGTASAHSVYSKLFDQKDRYNLAPVEFLPYLTYGSDLDTVIAISDERKGDNIIPFKNNLEIGGEVSGIERLTENVYLVRRDIYVKPGGTLEIMPGATLRFEKSVGMMVQGTLLSGNDKSRSITYTLSKSTSPVKSENVRLSNITEGRLEVFVDNKWGTVCTYGWDIADASVACHQMGLVLHPDDWILEQSQFPRSAMPNFILSNIQCTLLDTDITHCKSEKDFKNSCFSEVGLRCYEASWSGLRLGMAAEESRLQNIVIEHAGLLDYSTNSFKPALQIDFNRHYIDRVIVRDNKDSGVGIMWNEMFSFQNQKITNSELYSNRKHGLVTGAQGIDVFHCNFRNNAGSGIHYNPMFNKREQKDLTTWINLKDRSKVLIVPDDIKDSVFIGFGDKKYLTFSKSKTPINFDMTTDYGRKLGIMVLNSFKKSSTEEMIIYKRLKVIENGERWNIRKNLTSFPLRTPGYGVSVHYDPGENPSGTGILYVVSVEGQKNRAQSEIFPTIHINNVSISDCGRGFSSHHFNRDQNNHGDHFHRYSNETILITSAIITGSKAESVFVWTPYLDTSVSDLAEVNYTLINCTIRRNHQGLLHYSRDIRNSNNIFHWTINGSVIEENKDSGVDIRLPYVWQYSENYTHSFVMHSTKLNNNSNFQFSIHGHFARVNMSNNLFQHNFCKRGVISFTGMEKEMLIENNVIVDNFVHYAVEFNLESHADKFGTVSANFKKNNVAGNRDSGTAFRFGYQPVSYAVAMRGVQPINITRNLFENGDLQYELLAGVYTGSLENSINVAENWWGTNNVSLIRNKIFDFDDWNGYVLAIFSPFLDTPNIKGGVYPAFEERLVQLDKPLGGRIFSDITLSSTSTPYIVASDLTIMPDVVLTIQSGVILEFYPSVGILVLGDLIAQGKRDYPIIMRPIQIKHEYRFRRQVSHSKSRLCIDEKCNEQRSDGFLEIFNITTEQWVPVCDTRFTERNAQVVCNELGYNTLNVHVKNGPRLDMGPTQIGRIRSWPHPLECMGEESTLRDCEFRLNGYVENYQCSHTQDFVYIYCGPEALDSENEDHWGGIRFSTPGFESHTPFLNRPTLSYSSASTSKLEHVQIIGAGILHGEKNGAVQMIHRDIQLSYVNIIKSAANGIEAIAVPKSLSFNELLIKDNLGVGISFLSLTGESSNKRRDLISEPLINVDLPYSVFGMVDICDTNKEMIIENRILVFYKYDNKPVDCVKIFSSLHQSKQIGFRILQFNLFNGTDFSMQPDVIRIFDGDIFNQSTPEPMEIGWQFGLESATRSYMSSLNTLSVQLHTIGGSGEKGFIAEVVTLPISHRIARDTQHNISYCEVTGNGQEGIAYRSAGEITPTITIRHNRIDHNGRELFGNFTAGNSAVLLDIRNALELFFFNNLLMANQGGLHIKVDSLTSATGLSAHITNNLFTENRNRETLLAHRGNSEAVHSIDVYRNYFTRNTAQFWDTIAVSQVVSNFTENMAYNNTGKHLLVVLGFKKEPLSYQTCRKNWFWKNTANDVWDRSTIISGNAGQRFNYNYLVNPDNDFELTTRNKSVFSQRPDVKESSVDASKNWWGFNGTAAIAGRIKDKHDQEELIEVQYYPFLPDNSSVLDGKCAGGWTKIGDTCFLYVGGIMNFSEAKKFCEMDNASMPYVKTNHDELMAFVERQQSFYQRYSDRVWIRSIGIPLRECAVLVNRRVAIWPCGEYFPFLCERDPEITVSTRLWFLEPLTIVFLCVASLAILVVLLCLGFWFCKSRQRYKEKLERRNSIRASIRSNRSLTGFSELGYKRRLERVLETEATPKVSEIRLNGSVDSIEKAPSRFSCSMDDSYDHTPADTSARVTHNSDYSDFVDRFHRDPRLENANINTIVHPTFDLTYENHGYIDRSVSRNSHEISRDWSTTTGSTLDMKRSLDRDSKDEAYQNGAYRNSPSPQVPSSRESNSRDGASSCSSSRQPPLETAM